MVQERNGAGVFSWSEAVSSADLALAVCNQQEPHLNHIDPDQESLFMIPVELIWIAENAVKGETTVFPAPPEVILG